MANDDGAVDREEIWEIRRAIERAENAGDAAAFSDYLDKNVEMLPASGPHRVGRDAVIEFHRDHFETYDIDVTFSIDAITVVGDLAVEHGTYTGTLSPTDGGEPRDSDGEYLYVYERQLDGSWQISRMSW